MLIDEAITTSSRPELCDLGALRPRGRPVIIARTSKDRGARRMRLGYAIATPEIIAQMRPSTGQH